MWRLNFVLEENETLEHKTPNPDKQWALFLDLDGTLLDIAETPKAITVPKMLVPALAAAAAWLDGALAIVSGRPLRDIDEILAPLLLPCAGEHGAVIRLPDGGTRQADPACAVPGLWKSHIESVANRWAGVAVESKEFNITVHFRQAPARRDEIRELLWRTIQDNTAGFEILSAHMAFELRHRSLTKGSAVFTFMRQAQFGGRIPVFVGDDVTDEDGFRAAKELGGIALHVADAFGGRPANVRDWLQSFRSGNEG
jgi:trehalose 6-phosphate phosphatase